MESGSTQTPAGTANGLRWDEHLRAVPRVRRPRRKWVSSEEAEAVPAESEVEPDGTQLAQIGIFKSLFKNTANLYFLNRSIMKLIQLLNSNS